MVYFMQHRESLIYEVVSSDYITNHNTRIVADFIATKSIEGCTNETLRNYSDVTLHLARTLGRTFEEATSHDIREWLADYQYTRSVSNRSMDNMRRVFSSFFGFMETEDYIQKSPMRRIKKIKSETLVKKPFSEEDIIKITDACITSRELAIVDFLNYTGVRVTELSKLNIDDINFDRMEGIVYGKGNKQRMIFLNPTIKVHLTRYLEERVDNNKSLFVSERAPYTRLTKSGIEQIIGIIGERAGVSECHPHRFRRTLATRLIDRGVPIEQVQLILGHSKIETTLIYARVNETNVKLNHQKFA